MSMRARPVTVAAALCGNLATARQAKTHDLTGGGMPDDFRKHMTANGLSHGWAIPIDDGDGTPLGVWSIFAQQPIQPDEFIKGLCHTITHLANLSIRRQETADGLARRAIHDPLTGLPNRGLFADRLEQALANASRSGTCWPRWFCWTSIISRRSTIPMGTMPATGCCICLRGASASAAGIGHDGAAGWG